MAHQLTIRKDGTVEMAFAGEGCWHGLGQNLRRGASIEEWRVAAGMDWAVKRSRVRYGEGANQRVFDDQHVLFRSDTKAPLAVVSHKFQVVQPAQVLDFFRDLVDGAGFSLETAGTLFEGRRFWALAKIDDAALAGVDKIGGYLLLSTACDGTMATTAQFTSVRVVCNNTLSLALSTKEKAGSVVKTTHRSVFDADAVKSELGVGRAQFARFMGAAAKTADTKIELIDAAELTMRLLAGKKLAKAEGAKDTAKIVEDTQGSKGYKAIMALFNGQGLGANLPTAKGTAWGWVNAVTQYTDYLSPARSQDNRMNNAMFGSGDTFKTEALELALAL